MSVNDEYQNILNRTSLIASIAAGQLSTEVLRLSKEQLEEANLQDYIKQEILPYEERVVFNEASSDGD